MKTWISRGEAPGSKVQVQLNHQKLPIVAHMCYNQTPAELGDVCDVNGCYRSNKSRAPEKNALIHQLVPEKMEFFFTKGIVKILKVFGHI